MRSKTRIIIADDHAIFRAGLKQVIEAEDNFVVVAEASDGKMALDLVERHKPDVLVSDISMDKMNGLQVAQQLKGKHPHTNVVFLTMHDEEKIFNRARDLDVKGYVLKDSAASDIISAIDAVTAGTNFASPALNKLLFRKGVSRPEKKEHDSLTGTERIILKHVAEYKTSREIGELLFISHRTVENYRTNICSKLQIRGSHALIKYALAHQNEL